MILVVSGRITTMVVVMEIPGYYRDLLVQWVLRVGHWIKMFGS